MSSPQHCSRRLLLQLRQRKLGSLLQECRQFSITATQQSRTTSFPTFHETSNTELSELLLSIRQKCLLPYYLNKDQLKLVKQQKTRGALETDPVTISIGESEATLEHLDFTKDIPNRKQIISRVLALVKDESEGWNNVALLLEGFEGSNQPLAKDIKTKILRRMCSTGQMPLAMKILREPARYGITLKREENANTVLAGIFQFAAIEDFQVEQTKGSFAFIEQFLDLLERKEHGGGTRATVREDIRRSPNVAALALGVSSMLVKLDAASNLEKQKAHDYGVRFVRIAKEDGLIDSDVLSRDLQKSSQTSSPAFINAVMTWHALKTANEVAEQIELSETQLLKQLQEKVEGSLLEAVQYRRKSFKPLPSKSEFEQTIAAKIIKACGLEA